MASFSELTIGLSILFGFILLGLVGELFYLLWWKKRDTGGEEIQDHHTKTKYAKDLPLLFCWKNPSCLPNSATNPDANDLELGPPKDFLQKGFEDSGEEGVESELMRLHNLCGPPRFLFTIKEETKEDLESVDGRSLKGSRTRSLSHDLVGFDGTPVLTPLASPTLRANNLLGSSNYHGFNFNPLFDSGTEVELNRLRSSPPPKFKFLRDAEEKLMRRLMEEAERKAFKSEDRDGSFIRILVGKNREREHHQNSNASQVLPLDSSPPKFIPVDNNKPIQP